MYRTWVFVNFFLFFSSPLAMFNTAHGFTIFGGGSAAMAVQEGRCGWQARGQAANPAVPDSSIPSLCPCPALNRDGRSLTVSLAAEALTDGAREHVPRAGLSYMWPGSYIFFRWLLLPGSVTLGRATRSPALAAFVLQTCPWASHRAVTSAARCKAAFTGVSASH